MYHHLLVPIDETELSTVTVGRAVEFAKAFGARITFFHAHIDHAASVSGDADLLRLAAPEQFAYSFEGRPVELLTKAEAAARAEGVPCNSVSTVSNSPHRAIVDVAEAIHCDLIFMASHGRRSHLGMMLGSQSLRVLTSSRIPVLISATSNATVAARTVGIIRDEHRSLLAALQAGLDLLGDARAKASEASPEVLQAMVEYVQRFPAALHHPKEDDYLFRLLRERTSELNAELDQLAQQHLRDKCLLGSLAETVDRYGAGRAPLGDVEWAIETYASFMREHMAREERVVLPAAEFHLTEADWQEIHAAFSENADPRFGGETEAEYRRLFSRIVNLAARKTGSRG